MRELKRANEILLATSSFFARELDPLSWVHWFNENRLHSSIGYLTPIEKENGYYREINPQHQPTLGKLALH